MRTIIAGCRTATDPKDLRTALTYCGWVPTVVISGTARGADRLGEDWALKNKVPIEKFPADWDEHGKSAGHIRNAEMAETAEALIALWDGVSPGTKSMIEIAKRKKLKLFVQLISPKGKK